MADTFKIKLTPDAILKQQFATVRKGYDSAEVDNYLDLIIADYSNFIDAIDALTKENKQLKQEVARLEQNVEDVPKIYTPKETPKPTTTFTQTPPSTNFEIIQRLSKLERQVYQLEQQLKQ